MRSVKLLFVFLLPLLSLGQNELSQCDSLMIKRQFDAAAECFEGLYSKNPVGPAYEKLLEAYLVLEDTGRVFKLARKQSKGYGQSKPVYYVDYWHFSRTLNRRGPDFSVLENLTRSNPFSVRSSAQQLEKYNYVTEAIALYLIAEDAQPNVRTAFERGQLHAQLGQYEAQYEAYILAARQNSGYLNSIKMRIAQNLSDDPNGVHNSAVKKVLYTAVKKESDPLVEQLLLFVLRQEGSFDRAFTFMRSKYDGAASIQPFLQLMREAREADADKLAVEIGQFLLNQKTALQQQRGTNSVLLELGKCYEKTQNHEALFALAAAYPSGTCEACFEWELYRAQFLFAQISTLENSLQHLLTFETTLEQLRARYPRTFQRGRTHLQQGEANLRMGYFDDALMEFARAEALLGDSDEGDVARLQKAMCAFYGGDIPWAKTQLEVLLQSTSKSIANDALENALMISANSVEDTLMEGLQLIREPMLLEAQGKTAAAIEKYKALKNILIVHELYDDVCLKLGKLYLDSAQWEAALAEFMLVQKAAGEGMWKEDALFYAAKCRFELGQSEAQVALEGYLLSYPAGLYFDQARTMYRTLAL